MAFTSSARGLRMTTARTAHRYAGSLYQLYSCRALEAGAYVEVNGPYDTFGSVLRSDPQPDGRFLNLIRGIKPRDGHTPVAAL